MKKTEKRIMLRFRLSEDTDAKLTNQSASERSYSKSGTDTKMLTIMSFGIALNIICAFIALTFRIPLYMDSIGTVLIAVTLGPKYAVMTGLCGSIISGTFDVYSLYFAPVQISTGLIAGLAYKKGLLEGKKIFTGTLCFSLPTAIISAAIAYFVFGGMTSAGSSYVVQFLGSIGVSKMATIFVIQIITEYFDKFLAAAIAVTVVNTVPKKFILSNSGK